MFAQIIFFVALGLLITLLVRRTPDRSRAIFRQAPAVVSITIGRLVKAGRAGWRSLVKFSRHLANRWPSRSTASRKVAVASGGSQTGLGTFAQFWQEERLEAKQQLMSHYEEGDLLFKDGKLEEAERFFLMAATRHPKDPKIYGKLGLIYLEMKNFTDAIEALKVSVKLDRYNPSRHYNLALSYWGNKDSQRSIVAIREAISLDPVTPRYRQLLEELLNKK